MAKDKMCGNAYETILCEDEVVWLKENCNKYPLESLAETLGMGVDRLRKELAYHNIKREFKKSGRNLQYNVKLEDMSKNQYDNYIMLKKIKIIKERIRAGKKIGKYKPIKAYANYCLVENEMGYRESFTWQELASIYKGAV